MRNTGNNYIFTSSFKVAFILHLKIETYKNVRTDYKQLSRNKTALYLTITY